MSYVFIKVERDGPVTIVTLNRPEVMNALHSPAHAELAAAFDAFSADPDQWVGIITGAGDRAFCAGNDLKHQASGGAMHLPVSGFAGIANRFDIEKPLIAAVNGIAMGGGFETALACDVIIASDNAKFALPEPRVGLIAGAGGVQRLPRVVGLQRAMDIILTARHVGADEAREIGIASRVVPAAELLGAARQCAADMCLASPLALRAAKHAVLRGLDELSLEEAMRNAPAYASFVTLLTSEDAVEGPLAFSQKRPPRWTGQPLPDGRWAIEVSR